MRRILVINLKLQVQAVLFGGKGQNSIQNRDGQSSHFSKKITLFKKIFIKFLSISQLCCGNKQFPNFNSSQKQIFIACSSYMSVLVGQLQHLWFCLAPSDSAPFVFLSQPHYGACHFRRKNKKAGGDKWCVLKLLFRCSKRYVFSQVKASLMAKPNVKKGREI